MTKKIESTAILNCKADKIEELKTALIELVNETVKEPGSELFRFFQNNEKPEEFVLWEIFKDQEALDLHMNSTHTQKIFALDLFELVSITHQTEVKEI